jgi:hypothetical protein
MAIVLIASDAGTAGSELKKPRGWLKYASGDQVSPESVLLKTAATAPA